MSAFRAARESVIKAVFAEAKRVSQLDPDGAYMLEYLDVAADFVPTKTGQHIVATVNFRGQEVWRRTFPYGETQLVNMSTSDFEKKISNAMRGNLSLVGQLHHARLAKIFPKSIREVKVGYDPIKRERIITVEFMNGHQAEALEGEAKTDLFTARCSMLYDLPHL